MGQGDMDINMIGISRGYKLNIYRKVNKGYLQAARKKQTPMSARRDVAVLIALWRLI